MRLLGFKGLGPSLQGLRLPEGGPVQNLGPQELELSIWSLRRCTHFCPAPLPGFGLAGNEGMDPYSTPCRTRYGSFQFLLHSSLPS